MAVADPIEEEGIDELCVRLWIPVSLLSSNNPEGSGLGRSLILIPTVPVSRP